MAKHRSRPHWTSYVGQFLLYTAISGTMGLLVFLAATESAQRQVQTPISTVSPLVRDTPPPTTPAPAREEPFEYASCRDADEDNALPLTKGERGYGKALDSDEDGKACENYGG